MSRTVPFPRPAAIFQGKRYEPWDYAMHCDGNPGDKRYGVMWHDSLEVCCAHTFVNLLGAPPHPTKK